MTGQRGFALPLVMWTLLLLAVIAASLGGDARERLDAARNAVAAARAEALADAGVDLAILGLLDQRVETRWQADGRPYALALGGGRAWVRVQDAMGLVDLNTGAEPLLRSVLAAALHDPVAQPLADAILARRGDRDGHGAAPLRDILDLRDMPGMSEDLYRRLEPVVTVGSGAVGVDPLVAPVLVLRALPGIDPLTVDAVLAVRQGGKGEIDRRAVAGSLAISSSQRLFAVCVEAEAGGATFRRLAILRLAQEAGGPFLVLAWRTCPTVEAH